MDMGRIKEKKKRGREEEKRKSGFPMLYKKSLTDALRAANTIKARKRKEKDLTIVFFLFPRQQYRTHSCRPISVKLGYFSGIFKDEYVGTWGGK